MARFRRNQAIRPVDSNKNIVNSLQAPIANTSAVTNLALAVDSAALASPAQVTRGSTINTVYLEVWIYGQAVADINSRISWGIVKNPGGNLTFPSMSVAGVDDNKKFIYAMGSSLVGNNANGQPGYLIRGWFSVPKRYRRMGANDRIELHIRNDTANPINLCILAIYKWYK